jgi:ABC-type Fe3+-citrate transport system substrate-binding protein
MQIRIGLLIICLLVVLIHGCSQSDSRSAEASEGIAVEVGTKPSVLQAENNPVRRRGCFS